MDLNTVQQIECAIDALTPEQREELYLWLDEHYLQPSDIQLKAAIDAGRFDERVARAVADHKAGRTQPASLAFVTLWPVRNGISEAGMATLDWSQCPAVESIPGKVSGAWVFRGTRVPVSAIFENLKTSSASWLIFAASQNG